MAASAKALQLVKPHVRKISFPTRSGAVPMWTGQNSAVAAAPSPSFAAAAPSPSAPPAAPTPMTFRSTTPIPFSGDQLPVPPWPQVGSLPRGGGIAYSDLPSKYKRRTISDAEMDAILTGGAP